jgi:hypothetical protein
MMAISTSVILMLVVMVYIATLTEVVAADLQMVQLRESGTTLMGLKLELTDTSLLMIPLKTSSLEIGMLE